MFSSCSHSSFRIILVEFSSRTLVASAAKTIKEPPVSGLITWSFTPLPINVKPMDQKALEIREASDGGLLNESSLHVLNKKLNKARPIGNNGYMHAFAFLSNSSLNHHLTSPSTVRHTPQLPLLGCLSLLPLLSPLPPLSKQTLPPPAPCPM